MAAKKPSEAEEEYFARAEAEKKRKRVFESTQALGAKEREELRQKHHLRCPKCGMQLAELGFRGVQVERCFGCNGIFLDEADVKQLIAEEGYLSRMLHFFAKGSYEKGQSS